MMSNFFIIINGPVLKWWLKTFLSIILKKLSTWEVIIFVGVGGPHVDDYIIIIIIIIIIIRAVMNWKKQSKVAVCKECTIKSA
jgi:hypothetical protein